MISLPPKASVRDGGIPVEQPNSMIFRDWTVPDTVALQLFQDS
jgi:hypothetical protein